MDPMWSEDQTPSRSSPLPLLMLGVLRSRPIPKPRPTPPPHLPCGTLGANPANTIPHILILRYPPVIGHTLYRCTYQSFLP